MKEYFEWKAAYPVGEIRWFLIEDTKEAVAIWKSITYGIVGEIKAICYKPSKVFYVNTRDGDRIVGIHSLLDRSQEISEEEFLRLAEFVYNDI